MDLSGLVFTADTHPLLMKMARAYKASAVPEKEYLKELSGDTDPYQLDGHGNIRDLCADIGLSYDDELTDRTPDDTIKETTEVRVEDAELRARY